MRKLTVGERQSLTGAAALLWCAGVDLDEPTTGISLIQKNQLFGALRKLAEAGKSILFVSINSRKFSPVRPGSHHAKGNLVKVLDTPLNQNEMIYWMFGQDVSEQKPANRMLWKYFKTKNLEIDDFRINIKNINLDLKQGEIIGLAAWRIRAEAVSQNRGRFDDTGWRRHLARR